MANSPDENKLILLENYGMLDRDIDVALNATQEFYIELFHGIFNEQRVHNFDRTILRIYILAQCTASRKKTRISLSKFTNGDILYAKMYYEQVVYQMRLE